MDSSSASKKKSLPVVWIFGDVHVDSAICELPSHLGGAKKLPQLADSEPRLLVKHYASGTWLICDILKRVFKEEISLRSWTKPELNQGMASYPDFPQSLYRVSPLSKRPADEDSNSELVYRIKDSIGWLNVIEPTQSLNFNAIVNSGKPEKYFESELEDPKLIILFDRNDGFRDSKTAVKIIERIKKLNKQPQTKPVILWIRSAPFFGKESGAIGAFLCNQCCDQTVVLVRGECLRRTGITLLQDGSVEQFVESVFGSRSTPIVSELLKFSHSAWYFREATMHFCSSAPDHASYHFCPYAVDEMWQPRLAGGQMRGYSTIIAASVAISIIQSFRDGELATNVLRCSSEQMRLASVYERTNNGDNQNAVVQGIQLGQVLSTFHYREGYATLDDFKVDVGDSSRLDSPIPSLFAAYLDPKSNSLELNKGNRDHRLSSLYFNRSVCPQLSRVDAFLEHSSTAQNRSAEDFLIDIVIFGLSNVVELPSNMKPESYGVEGREFPRASVWCPYAQFGKILTADRDEIESYMSIYSLLFNYFKNSSKQPAGHRPFSVAVFGAPGSGKNFAIKQLVKCIDPRSAAHALEYNISQFSDVGDLMAVLHHIHDLGSSGITPLVILDEFDCSFSGQQLGWLKYFLAPMQDGIFKDRGQVFKIGRSIFLFAGGTSHSFKDFHSSAVSAKDFKALKGPDFVSRLRGHLDIQSLDCPHEGKVSNQLRMRRATLLRSLLEERKSDIFVKDTKEARIERSLVRAFLNIEGYKHGARSMEAILEMSSVNNGWFRCSSLPMPEQLEMHVRAEDFLKLSRSD